MCLTVINTIPRDMVIKNGEPFTNITSSTIVMNLCNLKKSLGAVT